MTEPTADDYLMGRFAAGDHAAFETLYRRHKDPVYRYFLRGTDAANAEDGHQETWSRVVSHRGRYRGQGSFRAWLFTIAHHVLMDQFRQPRHGNGVGCRGHRQRFRHNRNAENIEAVANASMR